LKYRIFVAKRRKDANKGEMGILMRGVIGERRTLCRRKGIKALSISVVMLLQMLMPASNAAFARDNERIIQGVPIIRQFPQLPTGCEATSATMLLRWAGVNVSKEDVARAIPRGSIPVLREGKLRGGNPNSVFVGNPFSKRGYGVYHSPIANVIDRYLPGKALDITGTTFNNLLEIVNSGRPVVVWVTINKAPARVSKIWYDSNGNKVVWKIPEHAVVLVGYTDAHVIVNDPWTGKVERWNRGIFKNRWEAMGRQAVTVKKQ